MKAEREDEEEEEEEKEEKEKEKEDMKERATNNTIYSRGRWRINFYDDQVAAAFDIAICDPAATRIYSPPMHNCMRRAMQGSVDAQLTSAMDVA